MKTGRARSKEEMPPEPQPAAGGEPAGNAATPDAAGTAQAPAPANRTLPLILVAVVALIGCIVLFLLMQRCGSANEWVEASQVTGRWTTGVQLYAPQVQTQETWQDSCASSRGLVQQATCVARPTGQYQDQPSRTYDEYAFNSYYEETYGKVYGAQGTEFVAAQLGGATREENNQRLVSKEYLKSDTCQQTAYTVWVDDPQDSTQEIEVYLSDCEVWQTVTVYDSETAPWCMCQLTLLAPLPVQTQMGTGLQVLYPVALIPEGGKADQTFEATVTFAGGDGQYTITQTTSDPAQYNDWLTTPYYLGIRDGRVVTLSKTPSK